MNNSELQNLPEFAALIGILCVAVELKFITAFIIKVKELGVINTLWNNVGP